MFDIDIDIRHFIRVPPFEFLVDYKIKRLKIYVLVFQKVCFSVIGIIVSPTTLYSYHSIDSTNNKPNKHNNRKVFFQSRQKYKIVQDEKDYYRKYTIWYERIRNKGSIAHSRKYIIPITKPTQNHDSSKNTEFEIIWLRLSRCLDLDLNDKITRCNFWW